MATTASDQGALAAGTTRRWARYLAPLLIAVLAVLAQARGLTGPFFFDDRSSILDNPHIRSLWPIWQAMHAPADTTVGGRPVVSLTLALNHALGGNDPLGYHVFNIALHAATAILLWLLLCDCLRIARSNWPESHRRALAFAVAALWAAHPLHGETVTYIIQRTELLMGLFFMLTLWCVARSLRPGAARGWRAAAVLACALGMASKEVMVGAPIAALLLDRYLTQQTFKHVLARRWTLYAGLAATWAVLAACVYANPRSESVGLDHGISSWQYLLTQSWVILHYLRLTVWPDPLVVLYEWRWSPGLGGDWPSMLAVGTLGLLSLLGLAANRWWGLAGALFFLILAPTSSLLPIVTEPIAERRMYLPLAVVLLLIVGGVARAAGRRRFTHDARGAAVLAAASLALAAALAGWSYHQLRHFANRESIYRHVLAHHPRQDQAHTNLGIELSKLGRRQEAIRHLRYAAIIAPRRSAPRVNLAVLYAPDQPRRAEALLRHAMALPGGRRHAVRPLAMLLSRQGRFDEALGYFRAALREHPGDASLRTYLAGALRRAGQPTAAAEQLSQVLDQSPDEPRALREMAEALTQLGRPDLAIDYRRRLVALAPGSVDEGLALARSLLRAGRAEAAVHELERLAQLHPEDPRVLGTLAWTLATHPAVPETRRVEATGWARRLVALRGESDPNDLDTLAAAHAAAGDFDQAHAVATRALKRARALGRNELAKQIEQRLALYQQGRAFVAGG